MAGRNVIIVMGPPGAGKGTQAKIVSARLALAHISTGDMLREAIRRETPMGLEAKRAVEAGQLVTDAVVNGIVAERITADDCQKGFILDGYPRNVAQAEAFNDLLDDSDSLAVIDLSVNGPKLVHRLTQRRTCRRCGEIYNLETRRPQQSDVCDRCGGPLIQRSDDTEEVIRDRMETYRAETEPLIQFYRNARTYEQVDGMAPIDAVTRSIIAIASRDDAIVAKGD